MGGMFAIVSQPSPKMDLRSANMCKFLSKELVMLERLSVENRGLMSFSEKDVVIGTR